MEVLSGVASVIAVLQLTSVLARALKTYYCGAREARSDIKRLFSAVSSLELLLRQIDSLPKNDCTKSLSELLKDPHGPLELIKIELGAVQLAIASPKKGKSKLGSLAQTLKWPLKSDEVMRTVAVIERHKATLNSHLGVGIIGLQIKDLDILSSIQNDLVEAKDDRRREKIIRWLSKGLPDPSVEHNAKREEHEDGTGEWLFQSKDFCHWRDRGDSCVWFNGGSGTGKSVMCSTVIEHLQHRSRLQHGSLSVISYWYFSFANKPTLDVSNALCSITRDLCSKSLILPKPVEDAWSDSNNGQQRPSGLSIFKMLVSLLNHFDNVYLVIDGIDEHPEPGQEQLLKVLSGLMSLRMNSLHLFVSSKPEIEISRVFRENSSTFSYSRCIRLADHYIQNDILTYLERKLNNDNCRKWSDEERVDIKAQLSSKADGMFRLIAIQWDLISKCHSPAQRRAALIVLPRSLYESYDQHMAKLEGANLLAVQKALTWLLSSARPLTIAELAEAAILSPNSPCIDQEERFDEAECILAIIPSSFIRLDNGERPFTDRMSGSHHHSAVQLAHHSVKDYLLTQQAWTLATYAISEPIINYLLQVTYKVDLESQSSPPDLFDDYPLLDYIIDYSSYHMYDGNKHDLILTSFLQLGLHNLQSPPSGEVLIPFSQIGNLCSQGRSCSQCTFLFHSSRIVMKVLLRALFDEWTYMLCCLEQPIRRWLTDDGINLKHAISTESTATTLDDVTELCRVPSGPKTFELSSSQPSRPFKHREGNSNKHTVFGLMSPLLQAVPICLEGLDLVDPLDCRNSTSRKTSIEYALNVPLDIGTASELKIILHDFTLIFGLPAQVDWQAVVGGEEENH